MTVNDMLALFLLNSYGNMLRLQGHEQREYAERLRDVCSRLIQRTPEGSLLWKIVSIGAMGCLSNDAPTMIQVGLVILDLKKSLV